MSIRSQRELEVTQEKLRGLESLYESTKTAATDNAYSQELTLRSLRRTINQLKEEIARFASPADSAVS